MISLFGLGQRDVSDRLRLQQPLVIGQGHPLKRRQLDGRFGLPRAMFADHFGRVQTIDGLSQCVSQVSPVLPTDGLMTGRTPLSSSVRLAQSNSVVGALAHFR